MQHQQCGADGLGVARSAAEQKTSKIQSSCRSTNSYSQGPNSMISTLSITIIWITPGFEILKFLVDYLGHIEYTRRFSREPTMWITVILCPMTQHSTVYTLHICKGFLKLLHLLTQFDSFALQILKPHPRQYYIYFYFLSFIGLRECKTVLISIALIKITPLPELFTVNAERESSIHWLM